MTILYLKREQSLYAHRECIVLMKICWATDYVLLRLSIKYIKETRLTIIFLIGNLCYQSSSNRQVFLL